jgi:energy-converting hydrogenase Eha subunit F
MRGLTLIGAAAALVLGVTAAPQPQVSVDNNIAPDAKTKVTTTTTVSKTKVITQTNIQVTTTTSYITATADAVTTITVYETQIVTDPISCLPSTVT